MSDHLDAQEILDRWAEAPEQQAMLTGRSDVADTAISRYAGLLDDGRMTNVPQVATEAMQVRVFASVRARRRRRIAVRSLAAAAVLVAVVTWGPRLLAPVAPTELATGAPVVASVAGVVYANGEQIGVTSEVALGTWIRTADEGEIALGRGAIGALVVAPKTEVRVTAWSDHDARIELRRGRVRSSVRKRHAGKPFEVRTPHVRVVVVGTVFVTEVVPGVGTRVDGISGRVTVVRRSDGQTLGEVTAGTSLMVDERGKATLNRGLARGAPTAPSTGAAQAQVAGLGRGVKSSASNTNPAPSAVGVAKQAISGRSIASDQAPTVTNGAPLPSRVPVVGEPAPAPTAVADARAARASSRPYDQSKMVRLASARKRVAPRKRRRVLGQHRALRRAESSVSPVKSNSTKSASPQRDEDQQKRVKYAAGDVGVHESGVRQSDVSKSDVSKPDVSKSDVSKPDVSKSAASEPDTTERRAASTARLTSARESLARGDVKATLTELDRLWASKTAPVVAIWTLRGDALLIGRRYRAAAAAWRQALAAATQRDLGRVVLDLAHLERRNLGATARARAHLTAYLAQHPNGRVADEALWQLAGMADGVGAERLYKSLVDQHPRSSRALSAASRLLRSLVERGRLQQAESLARVWQDHTVRNLSEVGLVGRILVAQRRGDAAAVLRLAKLHRTRFVGGRYRAAVERIVAELR